MIWVEFTNEGDDGLAFPALGASSTLRGDLIIELYPVSYIGPDDQGTAHRVVHKEGRYIVNGRRWKKVAFKGSPNLRLNRLTSDSAWAIGLEKVNV